MATNGNNGAQFTSTNAPSTVSATSGGAEPSSDSNLGKDEVAWFFVEQYYTTLSKTPEKLHVSCERLLQLQAFAFLSSAHTDIFLFSSSTASVRNSWLDARPRSLMSLLAAR